MAEDDVMDKGHIIVGVDSSPESIDALRLAGLLADGLGSSIDVVAVLPGGRAGPNLVSEEEAREAYFTPLFEAAAEVLEGDFARHRLEGVSAPAGLTSVAERLTATAIVIGSHARGPIGRVLMGDVGARLSSGAPCAVIVAPRGYSRECPDQVTRIGIGFDGRPESDAALAAGTELAVRLGASASLVAAVPLFHAGGRIGHTSRGYEHLVIDRMSQRLAEVAGRQDGEVDFQVRVGDPADCLAEASEDLDLLVLSSRGYGPVKRVVLGGVSVRVMRSSACPVLVVPRAHSHD